MMTSSLILRVSARPMAVLLGVISLRVLLRGHDAPGGGFIGGLVMASAFALHAVACGADRTRALLRVEPRTLTALGLACVAAGALVPLLAGDSLLATQWWATVPGIGKIGTALVFDAGVYLVVWGMMLSLLLPLTEEDR